MMIWQEYEDAWIVVQEIAAMLVCPFDNMNDFSSPVRRFNLTMGTAIFSYCVDFRSTDTNSHDSRRDSRFRYQENNQNHK